MRNTLSAQRRQAKRARMLRDLIETGYPRAFLIALVVLPFVYVAFVALAVSLEAMTGNFNGYSY